MIKEKLTLLSNNPNVLNLSQSTIDTYSVDDVDKQTVVSTLKLFSSRAQNHISYKIVLPHIDNGLEHIDISRIKKYPLPAVFNIATRRGIINISAAGRRSVTNIESRDMYALLVYTIIVAYFSGSKKVSNSYWNIYADYLSGLFLRIFAKRYGLSGSYTELIPELRYFVSIYVLVSFFDYSFNDAFKKASSISKFNIAKLNTDISNYDFTEIGDLVKVLSDSGVLPGLNIYIFVSTMINNFGVINLPIFEDVMRFNATMVASSINGNTMFAPQLQAYNRDLYNRIIESVMKSI